MNIQRFTGATAREALAKARMAFGDGTLILSNRPIAGGVEVMATAEDALQALDEAHARNSMSQGGKSGQGDATQRQAREAASALEAKSVEEDTEQLAMSTLSFQDYVRERMLRRRHEALNTGAEADETQPARAAPQAQRPAAPAARAVPPARAPRKAEEAPARPVAMAAPAAHQAPAGVPSHITEELQAMKAMIEDRFNTLSWLGQAQQRPVQSSLMLKLIRAGYSPTLSRAIMEKLPPQLEEAQALRWVMDVLERNLRTGAGARPLYEEGGVFALVGSTGVGKTTTAAKLAGLCAQAHGPASVGLITLDTYRIGAHDQLRTFGRMMGIVAHLAHDQAALQDMLGLLSGKKLVLIDTTGVAPHDTRKQDMLQVLNLPSIKRLMVMNAGAHGDTLDDMAASFKSSGVQQAVISKVDEAVKLGPVLDAAIRHHLVVRGVTNGQRVPEDWEEADAASLVRTSMRSPAKSAFDPVASDLNLFFADSRSPATAGARLHA
ncbi:MAG: hypothetical protein RL459_666 [Pseudomonadota bacterium]|jgi:flagellar biosynthesis protein FlhF